MFQRHDLEEVEWMPFDGNELVTVHPCAVSGVILSGLR